jgi:hypothetical protein
LLLITTSGHTKPLLNLAARLLDARPDMVITYLLSTDTYMEKASKEIERVIHHPNCIKYVHYP